MVNPLFQLGVEHFVVVRRESNIIEFHMAKVTIKIGLSLQFTK